MEVVDSHAIYYTNSLALKYVGCFLLLDLLRYQALKDGVVFFLNGFILVVWDPLITDFLVGFTTCFLKEGLMKLNLMVPLIHILPITSVL